MRARVLTGGARPSRVNAVNMFASLAVLLASNYVTFLLSGGVERLGGRRGGIAAGESGAVSHLREHHGSEERGGGAVDPVGPGASSKSVSVVVKGSGPPRSTSALGAFCTDAVPAQMSAAVAAEAAARQWDDVSKWSLSKSLELMKYHCFLTALKHGELRFLPVHICTHNPEVDQVMAASFHKWGWWGANADHRFVLAGGYAAGTPLTPLDAERMRSTALRARAEGKPFADTASLVAALGLGPVTAEDKVHSACSRERPFMLDVGGNVGYYTIVAAGTGCSVLTVEPLAANIGRLWQSVLANRFEDRVTLFKNVIGKDVRLVTMQLNEGNPGASHVSDGNARKPHEGESAGGAGRATSETVATIVLDELFDGSAGRPRHPFTDAPIAPGDVAVLKVDVEGFDAAALYSLRGFIEVGRPPLIKIEYVPGDVRGTSGCDNVGLIKWLYSLGYSAYAFGFKRPFTLEEWEQHVIPHLLEGKAEELHKEHDLPPVKELYLVHEDSPVPAVMEYASEKGGASPV